MMLFRGTILLFTLLSFTIMQVQCASQHVVNRQSNPDLKGNRKVQCIENVEVIDVQRKSSNNGFHRDVLTEVKISALSNSECHLLQVEHLPSTIYIDIYQIESRHSETKVQPAH
uniref:Phosphatidylinositol-glycan biosynthesis class X protein n=1 Tax=Saccoglossus kowalevskii TaxID=10224 RepID=A0ABM0LYK8_SACKO